MADYNVSQNDIYLLKKSKKMRLKAYLLDENNNTVDELEGYITDGSGSEDCTSDVRRTCSFTLHSYDSTYDVGEYNRIWLNNRVKIDIGFEDFGAVTYYTKGTYVFDSCDYSYTGSTRDISISCSDLITMLDGTHGGTLDGVSFLIEGCTYDSSTGTWSGNDIKQVVEDLLEQNGFTEYRVDTIGQVSCLQNKSTNWKENRIETGTTQTCADNDEANGFDNLAEDTGTWHMIPYDLEFDSGITLWDVFTKIRDLYSGYEMYFDKDGMFIFQLIPTCEHDEYVLDHTQFEGLVISEDSSLDLTTVRNATRIYGESIEYDYVASSSTIGTVTYNSASVYSVSATISSFAYTDNIVVGIKFPTIADAQLNNAAYLTISSTTYPIVKRQAVVTTDDSGQAVNTIVYNQLTYADLNTTDVYCFKYMSSKKQWVYAGMYQIEGYCEENSEENPFSVDKIGLRLQVLSGGDYEDITTSTLAQERAEYENWLTCRLNDSMTLETVIIPFLETNKKIEYRKLSDGSIDSYIIKTLSYSFNDGKMTMTMCKFYELDPFIVCS